MAKSDINNRLVQGSTGFEQAQAFISLPSATGVGTESSRIRAVVLGDFTISAGNDFNSPLATSALENLSQKANILKGAVQSGLNKAGVNKDLGGQINFKNQAQTTLFWTGSKKPTFNLDLLFITLSRGYDVREEVLKLYESVFPTKGLRGLTLNAPLGYDGTGRGTFAVQLGTWFRARNLVMTSVNFTFSQSQTIINGIPGQPDDANSRFAPLYARGSISFEPFRDIFFNEFKGYFI